ncbi:MAG: hypothetical protein M1274_07905 [Actinobacteria bacterium]|nr:hypothetical protein [Actinomycetota bacterium]
MTPRHLTDMYAVLKSDAEGKAYSSSTIRGIHTVFHHALKDAEKWGFVGRNPANFVRPPRNGKTRDLQIWTPEQIRDFLEAARADRLYSCGSHLLQQA